ncbi:hypothetical protein J2M53_10590 [Arthrobacter sp. zg-ZUI100]|uniref:hypothetical protein n=1 Tax=Arthrobacter jiangjiafuii TaxID=2817475 RepID=UPI001AEDA988|nr:hypothetical protein [Arthrobacter jiangjiafuii]MBP3036696.1 hypothetical protein [Arthrobacter jiangjiafuii]
MTLLSVFAAFLPALIVAGTLGYVEAPFIAVFGMMAGILIGGRYWWGRTSEHRGRPSPSRESGAARRSGSRKTPKPAMANL